MIKIGKPLVLSILLVVACSGEAQQDADREKLIQAKLATSNPLEASDSMWIEELTYMEVRDRIADGYSTAIIATSSSYC